MKAMAPSFPSGARKVRLRAGRAAGHRVIGSPAEPAGTLGRSRLQDALTKKLIENLKIGTQQVIEAQKLAKANGGNVALSLVRLGAVSEKDYGEFLASFFNVPLADLTRAEIDPNVA